MSERELPIVDLIERWTLKNVDGGSIVVANANGRRYPLGLAMGESIGVVPVDQLRGAVEALSAEVDDLRSRYGDPERGTSIAASVMADRLAAILSTIGGQ